MAREQADEVTTGDEVTAGDGEPTGDPGPRQLVVYLWGGIPERVGQWLAYTRESSWRLRIVGVAVVSAVLTTVVTSWWLVRARRR